MKDSLMRPNPSIANRKPSTNRSIELKKSIALLCLLAISSIASAKPTFTGSDYSGIYDCTGIDDHEGKYTGVVTLALVPAQSINQYGAYSFKLEVPGYGSYSGQAAANDNKMAIHFALTDQSTKDYGTGIASFKKNKQGKWAFNKFYYEPEFKDGNYGTEECVQR